MTDKERSIQMDQYPEFYQHCGGHLPFPPKDCPLQERIFTLDGVRWIDIAFCATNKCGKAPCARRREYDKAEWKSEHERLVAIRKAREGR